MGHIAFRILLRWTNFG